MFLAYSVVAVLLALAVLASASAQLARRKAILDALAPLGIPLGMLPFLASCLIAGGVGLLAGVWYAPLGIAAAAGLVLYFVGAFGVHLRKAHFKGLPAPTMFLMLAASALALRVLSSTTI